MRLLKVWSWQVVVLLWHMILFQSIYAVYLTFVMVVLSTRSRLSFDKFTTILSHIELWSECIDFVAISWQFLLDWHGRVAKFVPTVFEGWVIIYFVVQILLEILPNHIGQDWLIKWVVAFKIGGLKNGQDLAARSRWIRIRRLISLHWRPPLEVLELWLVPSFARILWSCGILLRHLEMQRLN